MEHETAAAAGQVEKATNQGWETGRKSFENKGRTAEVGRTPLMAISFSQTSSVWRSLLLSLHPEIDDLCRWDC